MSSRKALRFGMVGGGPGAFIGAVHNRAATVDGLATLVAGAFSSDAAKSREQGEVYRLAPERVYASFEAMAEREAALPKDVRVDFVSIVTPNHLHFPVAKAFVERGFHVVCDKPLTTTLTCSCITRAVPKECCRARRSRWERRIVSPFVSMAPLDHSNGSRRTRTSSTCAMRIDPWRSTSLATHSSFVRHNMARECLRAIRKGCWKPSPTFMEVRSASWLRGATETRPILSTSISPLCATARPECTSSSPRSRVDARGIGWMQPTTRPSEPFTQVIHNVPSSYAIYRPMGRSSPRDRREEGSRVWIRRARAGLLGRSLRRRTRAVGGQLLSGATQSARTVWSEGLCHQQSPRGTGRLRSRGRAAQVDHPGARVGRWQARGRQRTCRERDEGHRARRRQARRKDGGGVHRFLHLAPALQLPSSARRLDRRRLSGLRRSVEPHSGRVRRSRRALRTGGPPYGDCVRHLVCGACIGGRRQSAYVRIQLRSQSLRLSARGLRRLHRPLRRPHLSRPYEGRVVVRDTEAVRRVRWPSALRTSGPLVGIPVARPRARRLRGDHSSAQCRRLRWSALGGMGGHRHGSRAWRERGVRLRALGRFPPGARGVRFGVRAGIGSGNVLDKWAPACTAFLYKYTRGAHDRETHVQSRPREPRCHLERGRGYPRPGGDSAPGPRGHGAHPRGRALES